MIELTDKSLAVFLAYANDAHNWSGTPLIGGNVQHFDPKEERGNLSDLVKKGLIEIFEDDGDNTTWIDFTSTGKQFAAKHGIDI